MIIILLLVLGINPIFAYNSGNAIVIKRKAPKKKALLDRKFVFIQEGPAFKTNSQSSTHSSKQYRGSTSLVSLSAPIKAPKIIVKTPQPVPSSRQGTSKAIGNGTIANSDIYDENSWSGYATESDENLGVRAWITNLQE